jgi:transcription initiation factor TFIIIB Brf1 subunit/transcription initiation factor TFIIB
MKKCHVCEIEKLETDFYKGYIKCKKCCYEVKKI